MVNNDFGDFKKRVDESLVKLKGQPLPAAAGEQAAASPAPAPASLAIDSTPSNADIEVDGGFVGNTPSTVSLAPGSHQINVKKKGFVTWTKTVNVTGGTIHMNAELDPEPAKP